MDSRRRRWTALAVSCLLSLLLLEAASRWVVARRLHRPRIYAPDAHTSFALRPGVEERHTSWEFQVVYRVDGDGYRLTPGGDGPAGGPRIALLGDSFTFGMGVEDGETVAAELARRLAGAGRPATVVNAGFAAGKAPDDALAFLASPRGRRLAADRVALVLFVGNDFLDVEEHVWEEVDAAGRPRVVRSPTDFANRLGGRGPVPWHLASPLGRLGTVRLAGRAWFAAVELPRYAEEKAERRRRLARRAGDHLPERFRTVLEGFRDRAAAGREHLVVGLVPSRAQAAGVADPDHDRLLAAAERWLDATSIPRVTFDRAAGFSAADHYPHDGHWRPSGHRRAAARLAPLLAGPRPAATPGTVESSAP